MRPGRRRVVRNALIAACAAAATWGIAWLERSGQTSFRASIATAYVGVGLLALTLLLGPARVLAGRPNPVSTHLRRDLGIWGGLFTLAHVVIGLQRHMGGRWWLYFTFPGMSGRLFGLRYDFFGITNWIGLAATIIVFVLLGISSDVALRRLGTKRWKWLQRWNYLLFLAVVVHGFVYQSLAKPPKEVRVIALAVVALAVLLIQLSGVRRVRAASASAARPRGERERS